MSEENEVQDEETIETDAPLQGGTEESFYVGTDPIYQNSAYPVTDPGPLDETKVLVATNDEACVVRPENKSWKDYINVHSPGYVAPADSVEVVGAEIEGDEDGDGDVDLDDLTVKDLRARAGELDIPGRSSMNHDELVEAIAQAEADADNGGE